MDLITVTRRSGLEFEIRVRGHSITSDLSGKDAGPSPAELLAGAFGACIAMAVQERCDRMGHRDGEVCVNLTVQMADKPKRIAGIVADVDLPRDVPKEDIDRVRRIAQHCVIHETFAHTPQVDIEFD